jgi:hypothetical protein
MYNKTSEPQACCDKACELPPPPSLLEELERDRLYLIERLDKVTKAIECLKNVPNAATIYKTLAQRY